MLYLDLKQFRKDMGLMNKSTFSETYLSPAMKSLSNKMKTGKGIVAFYELELPPKPGVIFRATDKKSGASIRFSTLYDVHKDLMGGRFDVGCLEAL